MLSYNQTHASSLFQPLLQPESSATVVKDITNGAVLVSLIDLVAAQDTSLCFMAVEMATFAPQRRPPAADVMLQGHSIGCKAVALHLLNRKRSVHQLDYSDVSSDCSQHSHLSGFLVDGSPCSTASLAVHRRPDADAWARPTAVIDRSQSPRDDAPAMRPVKRRRTATGSQMDPDVVPRPVSAFAAVTLQNAFLPPPSAQQPSNGPLLSLPAGVSPLQLAQRTQLLQACSAMGRQGSWPCFITARLHLFDHAPLESAWRQGGVPQCSSVQGHAVCVSVGGSEA
ncbi:hypothetical protein WJX73_008994 [Symbiochloris irregularis]|uniref:Uncharacterized protein n=1 Tax=Symbiochloris irregularis TaxID=706552 RepID=A0AAW1P890_9CHLO